MACGEYPVSYYPTTQHNICEACVSHGLRQHQPCGISRNTITSEGYQTIAYTENYKYTRAVVDSAWQKDTFTNRAVVEIATTWSVICRSIAELEECKVMYTKSCLFITDNGREFTLFFRPLFSVYSVPKDGQLCLINAAMCCKPSREQNILIFVYNFLLCNIVGTQEKFQSIWFLQHCIQVASDVPKRNWISPSLLNVDFQLKISLETQKCSQAET